MIQEFSRRVCIVIRWIAVRAWHPSPSSWPVRFTQQRDERGEKNSREVKSIFIYNFRVKIWIATFFYFGRFTVFICGHLGIHNPLIRLLRERRKAERYNFLIVRKAESKQKSERFILYMENESARAHTTAMRLHYNGRLAKARKIDESTLSSPAWALRHPKMLCATSLCVRRMFFVYRAFKQVIERRLALFDQNLFN